MYVIKSTINGGPITIINHYLHHGIVLNDDEIRGPRLPGEKTIPLRCIQNCFGDPRIVYLNAGFLIPETLLGILPKSPGYELQKVITEKWICEDYTPDFGSYYDRYCHKKAYRNDPDDYVQKVIQDKPECRNAWDYYELKTFPIRCLPKPVERLDKYVAVRGHQDDGLDDIAEVPTEILNEYHMLHADVGPAFEDSLFQKIIRHMNLDYFQWKEYRLA